MMSWAEAESSSLYTEHLVPGGMAAEGDANIYIIRPEMISGL